MSYIIDIETGAKPESELHDLMPEFEASKVLKDPEKIKADLERKKQEWLESGALHAERGTVLVVGILNSKDETISFVEGNERDVVLAVWKLWFETSDSFVGHCIKTFDVPFLIRRSWILGIQTPIDIMKGRYMSDRFIDTMERWSCGTRDTISLDNLSKALGFPGKNGKGSEFAKQYALGGEFKQKALNYLKNDLIQTYEVAKKMGLL